MCQVNDNSVLIKTCEDLLRLPSLVLPSRPPPTNILFPRTPRLHTSLPPYGRVGQRYALRGNAPAMSVIRMALSGSKRPVWFALRLKIVLATRVYVSGDFHAGFVVLAVAPFDEGEVAVVAPCPLEVAPVRVRDAIRTAHRFLAVRMLAGFRGTRFLEKKRNHITYQVY